MLRQITLMSRKTHHQLSRFMASQSEQKYSQNNYYSIISNTDAENFLAYFPKIVNDVVDHNLVSSISEVNKRLADVLNYNVPHGSHASPHLLIYSYKYMENYNKTYDEEKMSEAFQMAWCLDILRCMSLVIDDVIDDSEQRRGEKTWYKLQGNQAICDGLLLQPCYLKLLEKYFGLKDSYVQILDTFNNAGIDTVVGESLHFEVQKVKSFTTENFRMIAKHKTSPIGFHAPLKLASLLSNQNINFKDRSISIILDELGILHQIQNDFYDCYGEDLIGKVGDDIQNNVCTILIATALEKGSIDQRRRLLECYGYHDSEKVSTVKAIYRDLKLQEEYYHLEENSRRVISTELKKIDNVFLRNLLENYCSHVYGRFRTEILDGL
ncbi:hypothetical protein WA026_008530 [Henosepilachna vigintioctopunctata]|uniref:Farnesyl pyrophosphate synthase n=1 Tax=Henosepilachna vigintioctopunctata TaxID=420089 RepID=A0AAW1UBV5_9CUCU